MKPHTVSMGVHGLIVRHSRVCLVDLCKGSDINKVNDKQPLFYSNESKRIL